MRPIKFRAWNEETKTMVDLYKITPLALHPEIKGDGLYIPFDDRYVIMQFTGLLDKDGKEIYEGDRVKTLYDHPFKFDDEAPWIEGEVEYSDGQWMVDYPDHGVGIPLVVYERDRVEVIGNIYEPKE